MHNVQFFRRVFYPKNPSKSVGCSEVFDCLIPSPRGLYVLFRSNASISLNSKALHLFGRLAALSPTSFFSSSHQSPLPVTKFAQYLQYCLILPPIQNASRTRACPRASRFPCRQQYVFRQLPH